jgi:large subunit ribosomal protein L21
MFWRFNIYAIIETGGKQYKVTEGQTIDVERLEVVEGGTIELDRVLLVADGKKITAGNPLVKGASVTATAKENGKSDKVVVFKYKPKVRYRRKNGHRQLYTRLSIDSITAPGMAKPKPAKAAKSAKKTTRRRKKEETVNGA